MGNSETTTTPRDRITNLTPGSIIPSLYDAHDDWKLMESMPRLCKKFTAKTETEHRQDNVPGTSTTTTVPQGDVKAEA